MSLSIVWFVDCGFTPRETARLLKAMYSNTICILVVVTVYALLPVGLFSIVRAFFVVRGDGWVTVLDFRFCVSEHVVKGISPKTLPLGAR